MLVKNLSSIEACGQVHHRSTVSEMGRVFDDFNTHR